MQENEHPSNSHLSGFIENETPNPPSQDEIYHSLGIRNIKAPPHYTVLENPSSFSIETKQTYVFTNENMAEFMPYLNLKDKKVACIGASADFIINAFYYGAQSVDAVDISPVACFMGELKLAALSQFSYNEFLTFFATTKKETFSRQSFSYDQYCKLKPHISEETQHFFNQLIIAPNERSDFLSPYGMLINKVKDMSKIKDMNPYLRSEEDYNKAKDALKSKSVIFYPQDIREFLDQHNNNNYDCIYLSNIFSYPPYITYINNSKHRDVNEIYPTIKSATSALSADGNVSHYEFHKLSKKEAVDMTSKYYPYIEQIYFSTGYNKTHEASLFVVKKSAF